MTIPRQWYHFLPLLGIVIIVLISTFPVRTYIYTIIIIFVFENRWMKFNNRVLSFVLYTKVPITYLSRISYGQPTQLSATYTRAMFVTRKNVAEDLAPVLKSVIYRRRALEFIVLLASEQVCMCVCCGLANRLTFGQSRNKIYLIIIITICSGVLGSKKPNTDTLHLWFIANFHETMSIL